MHTTNVVISNAVDTDEPWILATNKNPNRFLKIKNQMGFILKAQ